MSSRRTLVVAACGALVACAAPPAPPPPTPPDVTWTRRHYAGSAVSGPTGATTAQDAAADDALHVRVRWVGLPTIPGCFEPIARRRRLLLDLDGRDLLRAVPVLSAGARAAPLPDVEQGLAALAAVPGAWPLGEQRAAVPPGVTAELAARAPGAPGRVALRVHRTKASTLDVAVVLEREPEGELVVLAPVAGDRLALGLVVPTPVEGLAALGAVVEVGPPPGPGEPGRVAHRAAHAACVADVARDAALARAAASRDPAPALTDDGAGLARALEALRDPAHRRGALFSLGLRTGARLVEDVALGGDDALVEAVARAALAAANEPGAPRRGPGLGWTLERAAVEAVAAAAEEDDPSAAVAAGLLVRAAGVVGAFPQSLRELAARAEDLEAWRARLVDTNQAALEDPSPLQRILAEEWLADRGALEAAR